MHLYDGIVKHLEDKFLKDLVENGQANIPGVGKVIYNTDTYNLILMADSAFKVKLQREVENYKKQ